MSHGCARVGVTVHCGRAILGGDGHAQRPRDDRLKRERPAFVGHPHRPIHSVFDDDVGRPDSAPHLIELPVVGHRPVTAQTPSHLNAREPGQIPARRLRPMQIGGLDRRDREAPIVARQPRLQEPIRGLDRGHGPPGAVLSPGDPAPS